MKRLPKINLARLQEIFTTNLSLKVVSVLLAILCWFVALNIEEPLKEKVITDVPITVVNGPYLESMGLSYQLKRDSVRVTVYGPRSIVNELDAGDILVQADMTQIVNMNSDPVMVPLSASCPRYPELEIEDFTVTPDCIALEVEPLVSESFVLTPSTGKTKPAKEYEVGTMSVLPEQITISGPESLVGKIDKILAKVDVDGQSMDGEFNGQIEIIDKNQEAFTEAQMKYLTLNGTDEDGNVRVSVDFWKLQTDVKIAAEFSGKPKAGYEVEKVTTTPETITVVGTDEALTALKEAGNCIEIPSEEIDVSGQSADITTKIDINEYLPEDIRLATDVSSSVIVTVTILPDGSKLYEVPVTNISQENLGENLMAVFGTAEIEVRLKGNERTLKQLKGEDITGYVDLANLTEGTHSVPVQIELAADITLVDAVTVEVTITKQETAVTAENINALQVFTGNWTNSR